MVELGGEPLLGRLWRQLSPRHTSTAAPILVAAAGDARVPAFARAHAPSARVVTQPEPDGVANAVLLALPHLAGPALVVLADIVLDAELGPPPPPPALVTWPAAPAEATRKNFGIRCGRDGAPLELVEKPSTAEGLLCGIGMYWLTPAVIERFGAAPLHPRTGEREITAALAFTMRETPYRLWELKGRYFNVNTAADLAEAEAALGGA
jgi:dTDP-glucose pyrophosphorylase